MNWYYAIEGSAHGPVTERSLAELARLGTVGAGTLIWHPELGEWASVSKLRPEILRTIKFDREQPVAKPDAGPEPTAGRRERRSPGFLRRIFGTGRKTGR